MPEALPKSFKWLIYANIAFAVWAVFVAFGFTCFGFGGYPPLAAFGGMCLFGSMLSLPAFVLMASIDLIVAAFLWKSIHFRILFLLVIIFGILAAAFFVIPLAETFGKKLSDSRFDRNFTRYAKVVAMFNDGSLEIIDSRVTLPSGYHDLAFFGSIFVQKDDPGDPNNVMVEFMVGSGGFAGHVAYLYSSTGTISENSNIAKRWPHRRQVRDNWFRASD